MSPSPGALESENPAASMLFAISPTLWIPFPLHLGSGFGLNLDVVAARDSSSGVLNPPATAFESTALKGDNWRKR